MERVSTVGCSEELVNLATEKAYIDMLRVKKYSLVVLLLILLNPIFDFFGLKLMYRQTLYNLIKPCCFRDLEKQKSEELKEL